MNKVTRDGKVAVLISPGFGAGWSSWDSGNDRSDFMLFDSRLVEMAERKATLDEVDNFLNSLFGEDNAPYSGGWDDIEIIWTLKGSRFKIDECDGYESLVAIEDLIHTA